MDLSAKLQRDVVMFSPALGAVAETIWNAYIGIKLPRYCVTDHWDLAWVGIDTAQVIFFILTSWAAWRKRAMLIWFSNTTGTLLLVDACFDVTTAKYTDVSQSGTALSVQLPSAFFLLCISMRTARRVTKAWL